MEATDRTAFPLAGFLGLRIEPASDGRVVARLEVDERHLNPNGVLHGAVPFALVDTAMGAAVESLLEPGQLCASTDVHLRFVRPVTGGRIEAEVSVTHRGRRTATLDGRVVDADGRLVATATGAFAIIG